MKPTLAAMICLLALSPSFAQVEAHPCQSRDQGWKAAFNKIEARFDDLPATLQAGNIPAAELNAKCSGYKSADDYQSCGAIVDRSVIKEEGLEQKGKSWTSDGTTITSVKADPIFDRVCKLRDQRERTHGGAGNPQAGASRNGASVEAQAKAQAKTAKTLAMAKKILAEADASGIGAPSTPIAARPAAPVSTPAAAPATFTVRANSCSDCACWCGLLPSACGGGDNGACTIVSSYAISCHCQ
jgi:hypothetical protein